MQLKDLKPAWQQQKLRNALQPIDQGDILLLIEGAAPQRGSALQRVLLQVIVFLCITLICQSG